MPWVPHTQFEGCSSDPVPAEPMPVSGTLVRWRRRGWGHSWAPSYSRRARPGAGGPEHTGPLGAGETEDTESPLCRQNAHRAHRPPAGRAAPSCPPVPPHTCLQMSARDQPSWSRGRGLGAPGEGAEAEAEPRPGGAWQGVTHMLLPAPHPCTVPSP
uniref:Uncharacterized protein n=1 Tax=Pipistrellus kuhlii TaxID=59472 RepID=A0A7J7TK69_PIPKU|nr:hypothetical protein mPipKuh1_009361 [Pipistrellus kuhlii]